MIDEIIASPVVTGAIAQQGLGLADQVGEEVGKRSRSVDDLIERLAHRLTGRDVKSPSEGPNDAGPDDAGPAGLEQPTPAT